MGRLNKMLWHEMQFVPGAPKREGMHHLGGSSATVLIHVTLTPSAMRLSVFLSNSWLHLLLLVLNYCSHFSAPLLQQHQLLMLYFHSHFVLALLELQFPKVFLGGPEFVIKLRDLLVVLTLFFKACRAFSCWRWTLSKLSDSSYSDFKTLSLFFCSSSRAIIF